MARLCRKITRQPAAKTRLLKSDGSISQPMAEVLGRGAALASAAVGRRRGGAAEDCGEENERDVGDEDAAPAEGMHQLAADERADGGGEADGGAVDSEHPAASRLRHMRAQQAPAPMAQSARRSAQ